MANRRTVAGMKEGNRQQAAGERGVMEEWKGPAVGSVCRGVLSAVDACLAHFESPDHTAVVHVQNAEVAVAVVAGCGTGWIAHARAIRV